jgi:hypothetical protein
LANGLWACVASTAVAVLVVFVPVGRAGVAVGAKSATEWRGSSAKCPVETPYFPSAEDEYFQAHHRYASAGELPALARPRYHTIEVWKGGGVYVVTPTKGKGCEATDASQRFPTNVAAQCVGVQQAVYGLQELILRGRSFVNGLPAARVSAFAKREERLVRALHHRLALFYPPSGSEAQWRRAVQSFDGYEAQLVDFARTAPTDLATSDALYQRHQNDLQRVHDAWAPLITQFGDQLQACQYMSFGPGAGE